MHAVNLSDKFAQFTEQWSPKIIAELNGQHVKIAKVEGAFDWHRHPDADELFMVIRGRLTLRFRERDDVTLEAGELCVVPRGVEHQPVAEEEVQLLLFEPAGTRNTGDATSARTVEAPEPL